MLITCSGCESKIKVPDAAAGKRVKCPKCATVIRVPAVEPPEEPASPDPEPPPEPRLKEPEPEEPDEEAEENAKTRVTASKSKSSSISAKSSHSKSRDEDDEEEEEDEPRSKRRRRDEDDDDLDVRKRRRRSQGANGVAMTSMIMGIVSVVFGLGGCIGCCCAIPSLISLGCGITAVICGHKTLKSPGSEGMAMTGLICGYVSIGLSLIGVVMFFLGLFLNIGMNLGGLNQPGFNPPAFNQPPPPRFR